MDVMKNCIYNENCIDTMSRMCGNVIDLTVTSPPYDNLRDYKGYSFDFETIARELFRVTKEGGVVVWVVNDATIKGSETGTSFRQALYFKDVGFRLHDTMIWCKPNPIPRTHNRYENAFEYMFVLSKGKPSFWNPIKEKCKFAGGKRSGTIQKSSDGIREAKSKGGFCAKDKIKANVWVLANKGDKAHPAVFPLKLAADLITSWSDASSIVFDPFIGSGTTAVAALTLGRSYIGSEIAKDYCDICEEKLGNLWML